jgi:hypothetical protein
VDGDGDDTNDFFKNKPEFALHKLGHGDVYLALAWKLGKEDDTRPVENNGKKPGHLRLPLAFCL